MTGTQARDIHLKPEWVTPAITALVGSAYLLGFLETAFFASALGVTARDLGLDIKDYAVLALLNVVLIAVATASIPFMFLIYDLDGHPRLRAWVDDGGTKAGRRVRRFALSLVGLAGASTIIAVGLGGLGVGSLVTSWILVSVAAAAFIAFELARAGRHRPAAWILAVLALAGVFGLACHSAHSYARTVRTDIQANRAVPMAPLPLRTVLQPERGIAVQGDEQTCGVRVAPRVILGRRGTTVAEVERFTVRQCDVEDVPFG